MGSSSSKADKKGISYWKKYKDKYYLVIRPSNVEEDEEKYPVETFRGGVQSVKKVNDFLRSKKSIEVARMRKCFNIFLTSIFEDIMHELDSNKKTEFSYDIRIICTYSERIDLQNNLSQLVKEKIESQNWFVKLLNIHYNTLGYMTSDTPFADFDLRTHNDEKCSYHGISICMSTKQYIRGSRTVHNLFYITPVKVYLDEFCLICLDDETKSSEVLLPCGHCCTCKDCYESLPTPKDCPKCRDRVEDTRPATKEELIPKEEEDEPLNKIGPEINTPA